ncbi:uncharacterized protein LOC125178111 [Hyalella azteca]|uniref:Outer dynein arm-docking complex subunit 4 n=1 Tax=Hyalella azteca TaxID=294128 RepID=A0A979FJE4_HYAAZ|nr:uncharacterized protein LOC125178111 [Hyalella azteca]
MSQHVSRTGSRVDQLTEVPIPSLQLQPTSHLSSCEDMDTDVPVRGPEVEERMSAEGQASTATNVIATAGTAEGSAPASSQRRPGASNEDKNLQLLLAQRRRSLEKQASQQQPTGIGPRKSSKRAKENTPRLRSKGASLLLARELQHKRRQAGQLTGLSEQYTDKDRAAAVTMGDQDIKTSLKVKRRGERRAALPEDLDWTVYLTEAHKNITTGHVETALKCAQKAVACGGRDPGALTTRGRCYLLLGRLQEAMQDAQEALQADPTMVKAVLVQAEALYGMAEFERALVLYERGARARPDMLQFCRGGHQCREAILNVIGGRVFPEAVEEEQEQGVVDQQRQAVVFTATPAGSEPFVSESRNRKGIASESRYSNSSRGFGSRSSRGNDSNKPRLLIPEVQTSKLASKRLLGGLSCDKEFLASLLNRRGLTRSVVATVPEETNKSRNHSRRKDDSRSRRGDRDSDEEAAARRASLGSSGALVAAQAKQALDSLQYLEAFLWQRNPAGVSRTGEGMSVGVGKSRGLKRSVVSRGRGMRRPRSEQARQRAALVKRVSAVLRKLETLDGRKWAGALREGEMLVGEVREGGGVGGDPQLAAVFCRLLVGVGAALPRAGRSEDALALLTDAAHIAHARDLPEDEQLASEWQGRVLANRGQHEEAVTVWQMCLSRASTHQRPTLFLLLARGYLAMIETEKAKQFCRMCVSEANAEASISSAAGNEQTTQATASGNDDVPFQESELDNIDDWPRGDGSEKSRDELASSGTRRKDLERRGNSETALTALLTLAGIEADSGDTAQALATLEEARPHLAFCPSLLPQFTSLRQNLLKEKEIKLKKLNGNITLDHGTVNDLETLKSSNEERDVGKTPNYAEKDQKEISLTS